MADALSALSTGEDIGLAAGVATLAMLLYGWWNLGT